MFTYQRLNALIYVERRGGAAKICMSRYHIRVQLATWYEVAVSADSPEEATERAESLKPHQILARGKRLQTETGLADPKSAELLK